VLNQYLEKCRDQRSGQFLLGGLELKFNTARFGTIAKVELLDDELHELNFRTEGKWAAVPLPSLEVNALLLVSIKK